MQEANVFDYIKTHYSSGANDLGIIRNEITEMKRRFPLESLKTLPIEDFVTVGNKYCFINMIENKTSSIASGSLGFNRNRLISQKKGSNTREICKFILNNERYKGLSEIDVYRHFMVDMYTFIKNFDENNYDATKFLFGSNVVKSKVIMVYRDDIGVSGFSAFGQARDTAKYLGIPVTDKDDALELDIKLKKFLFTDPEIARMNMYIVGRLIWSFYANFVRKETGNKKYLKIDREDDQLINNNIDEVSDDASVEDTVVVPPALVSVGGTQKYPRDPSKSKASLRKANYCCEVNRSHPTFIRCSNGHPYTEPHHLIPMAAQGMFPQASLDVPANIVSLCSNCHNHLHYGKDIRELLLALYNERKERLKKAGLDITFDELLSFYE